MRRMSFSLTKEAIITQRKTVTRRQGWSNLKVGDIIQPIEKGMGLKKGEKQKLLGCPIVITSIELEPIEAIEIYDVVLEGFHDFTTEEFINMYCKANKVKPYQDCHVIRFDYTEPLTLEEQDELAAEIINQKNQDALLPI
jgi:hypothetical protein